MLYAVAQSQTISGYVNKLWVENKVNFIKVMRSNQIERIASNLKTTTQFVVYYRFSNNEKAYFFLDSKILLINIFHIIIFIIHSGNRWYLVFDQYQ